MIKFFVEGEPRPRGSKTAIPNYNFKTGWPIYVAKPSVRKGKVVRFARVSMRYVDSKDSNKWMKAVAGEAEQFRQNPLWDGPVTMLCGFCYEYPKSYCSTAKGKEHLPRPSAPVHKTTMPDVIKLGRAIEDALKGVIYSDDARIVHQQPIKCYSRYTGVWVCLWPGAQDLRYRSTLR